MRFGPVTRYMLYGCLIGGAAGLLETGVAALRDPEEYWPRFWIYYGQLGFCGWGFGAVIGYIVAKRRGLG